MSPKKSKHTGKLKDKKKSQLKKKLSIPADENRAEADDDKFIDVLNKKLKVFRVSPIYNFSKNKLKFFERKLDEEMNSRKKLTSNVVYKSKLTLNKDLRLNDQCAEALQVEIIKNDSFIRKPFIRDSFIRTIYTGHFLSWSNTTAEGAVSLPILLVEGKAHIMNMIHSCLCKIFDCDIQPVIFSLHALITFLVSLLGIQRNNIDVTQEQVTLEYKVPECEANDRIKISFILEATIIVLAVVTECLQEKYPGITSKEVILEFYNKMLNHAYRIFKMDLGLCELQKVVFPDAFLTSDGQLKMSTNESAIGTLEVLQVFTPLMQ